MREVREKNLEGEIELEFEGESRKLTKHITFHSFISIPYNKQKGPIYRPRPRALWSYKETSRIAKTLILGNYLE